MTLLVVFDRVARDTFSLGASFYLAWKEAIWHAQALKEFARKRGLITP